MLIHNFKLQEKILFEVKGGGGGHGGGGHSSGGHSSSHASSHGSSAHGESHSSGSTPHFFFFGGSHSSSSSSSSSTVASTSSAQPTDPSDVGTGFLWGFVIVVIVILGIGFANVLFEDL